MGEFASNSMHQSKILGMHISVFIPLEFHNEYRDLLLLKTPDRSSAVSGGTSIGADSIIGGNDSVVVKMTLNPRFFAMDIN